MTAPSFYSILKTVLLDWVCLSLLFSIFDSVTKTNMISVNNCDLYTEQLVLYLL